MVYVYANGEEQICEDGGIAQRTNHSLRATGASEMFRASVPEKVIQTRTGHMSLKGLRVYEHVTDEQHKAACGVLTPLPSNEQVPCRQNETMVNSLFGNPQMQNCTINVQVFNYSAFPGHEHFYEHLY